MFRLTVSMNAEASTNAYLHTVHTAHTNLHTYISCCPRNLMSPARCLKYNRTYVSGQMQPWNLLRIVVANLHTYKLYMQFVTATLKSGGHETVHTYVQRCPCIQACPAVYAHTYEV